MGDVPAKSLTTPLDALVVDPGRAIGKFAEDTLDTVSGARAYRSAVADLPQTPVETPAPKPLDNLDDILAARSARAERRRGRSSLIIPTNTGSTGLRIPS